MVNQARPAIPSSPPRAFQVLVLEPDEKLSAEIVSALQEAKPGTTHAVARSVVEAQKLVVAQKPELFVLDVDAGYASAQEFIYDLRTSHPTARAIVLTATHFTAQRDQVSGLGAMHFLEKPFPKGDFITLVEALLASDDGEGERFQGTLSDLHIADIVQLKCISGATSMLEFTGPRGEKARVYFENGQVRHATAPGKEGREAFNQIVDWKGGVISEVPVPKDPTRTITLDWQILLMEAVRHADEARQTKPAGISAEQKPEQAGKQTVVVIDDSLMLLSFVKEILADENYHVLTAATAEEGLKACHTTAPGLILLDYILPDMKGDEVCRKMVANPVTSKIPVVYMSGFGTDLQPNHAETPNIIGSLSKPFTSESLIKAVQQYLPGAKTGKEAQPVTASDKAIKPAAVANPVSLGKADEKKPAAAATLKPEEKSTPKSPTVAASPTSSPTMSSGKIVARESKVSEASKETAPAIASIPIVAAKKEINEGGRIMAQNPAPAETTKVSTTATPLAVTKPAVTAAPQLVAAPKPEVTPTASTPADFANAYFCGDSSFFSLHWALQTIAREKLTGVLRTFWSRASVELLASDGRVVLVTTRDPALYCEEAPVTLLNVDAARIEAARAQQTSDSCPMFVTLVKEGLILRDPGLQLVQHYGQKLFAQLWTADRVRFVFEQQPAPAFTRDLPATEESLDQWALSTLRFVQYQELGKTAMVDPTCVPAYTRDGYERVQHLRLTVAEAQFASQFNGSRSVAQIAKNLRLDIKFARLTLFRFLALEIVECWPAQLAQKPEGRGGLRGFFGR